MSRKDYVAIAAAIARTRGLYADSSDALDEVAREIAEVFANDNERFDHARFYAACGCA